METPEFKTRSEVGELVPHAGKMLLLDRVIRHDLNEVSIETEVDINESCMFYRDDRQGVPSYVAFEYMAQSISALSGVYGRTHGQKPREGFIMSVSNCKLLVPVFKAGDVVRIRVKQTMRVDMAVTFDGAVYVGDTLAVSASLCTVEVDDPMSILKMN
ncbi:thioester dehydrase [Fibrobacter succinogenes]|uniref:ApeP family dehydratase n=1 Tax=Fibrobacter succinogenes TaxID=833 RepID=UPI00156659A1|nr:thioester dehydrase [Fibrobacter succinogenes]